MASWAALTAAEVANAAANIPLLGVNAIPVSPTTERWTEVGGTSDTDRVDATYPIRRAHEGKTNIDTRPDGTSSNDFYIVYDFGSAGIDFDFAALGPGHNLGSLSLSSLKLEASTSADFSTTIAGGGGGPSELCDFGTPSNAARLAQIDLFHTGSVALRYFAIRFVRLKIGAGSPITPRVTELWLARRRQLWAQPLIPHAPDEMMHVYSDSTGTSGVISRRNEHRRRSDISHGMISSDAAEVADLQAFYRECRGPFIYMPQPAAAPEEFRSMMLQSQYRNPGIAAAKLRRHTLIGIEQGPERHFVDVELN